VPANELGALAEEDEGVAREGGSDVDSELIAVGHMEGGQTSSINWSSFVGSPS
jgi:hypothetical protein